MENQYSRHVEPANPYAYPSQGVQQTQPERWKHSGIGIFSFLGALAGGFGIVALIVIAGFMEVNNPGVMEDENSPVVMFVGLLVIGCGGLTLLSLGLGIGCLFQKNRKRIFGILGLIMSALVILSIVGLFIIGSAV